MSRPSSLSERERDAFWREVEWLYGHQDETGLRALAETLPAPDVYALVDNGLSRDEQWAEKHLKLAMLREFNQLNPSQTSMDQQQHSVAQWLAEVSQTRPAYQRYALGVHLCQVGAFRHWAPIVVGSLAPSERLALLNLPHVWPDSLEAADQFEPLYALLDDAQRLTLAPKVLTDAGFAGDRQLLPMATKRVEAWGYQPADRDWAKVLFDTFVDQRPWLGALVEDHRDVVAATALRAVEMEEPDLGDRFASLYASEAELSPLLDAMKAAHTRARERQKAERPPSEPLEPCCGFPLTVQRALALQRRCHAEQIAVGEPPKRPRARA